MNTTIERNSVAHPEDQGNARVAKKCAWPSWSGLFGARWTLERMVAGCAVMALCVGHVEGENTNASDLALAPVDELFYQGAPAGADARDSKVAILGSTQLLDGELKFIALPHRMIGILADGPGAMRVAGLWSKRYQATPLEIWKATAPRLQRAPRALVEDHYVQVKSQRRSTSIAQALPSVADTLVGGVAGAPLGGFSHDWFSDSGACGDEDIDLFWYWFQSNDYDDWGMQGESGYGQHEGNANITLGPSASGVIAICQYEGEAAELKIQEFIPGLGWVHVLTIPHFGSFGYGYIFNGWGIRNVRMTIRDAQGAEYFWAASY